MKSPKGIILDLRNNGGGLMNSATEIASEFLAAGAKIVNTSVLKDSAVVSSGEGFFLEIPLIVLVNNSTASAAEILAGAILENKRGLIIGEKTFGKGIIQHVQPLSDGSYLKVTIAEWITPLGNHINKKGIAPQEIVVQTNKDYSANYDPVMVRAMEIINTEEANKIVEEYSFEKKEEKKDEGEVD